MVHVISNEIAGKFIRRISNLVQAHPHLPPSCWKCSNPFIFLHPLQSNGCFPVEHLLLHNGSFQSSALLHWTPWTPTCYVKTLGLWHNSHQGHSSLPLKHMVTKLQWNWKPPFTFLRWYKFTVIFVGAVCLPYKRCWSLVGTICCLDYIDCSPHVLRIFPRNCLA